MAIAIVTARRHVVGLLLVLRGRRLVGQTCGERMMDAGLEALFTQARDGALKLQASAMAP
jgi:hypothetical protein